MPFKLRLHDDWTTGLVAVCDVCGRLASGDDANILWIPPDAEKPVDLNEFKITCKEDCTRAMDNKHGCHHYSQPLDAGVGYLANNLKIDWKKTKETMRMLAMLG